MSAERSTLYQYFFFKTHPSLIYNCLSVSLISGCISSFVAIQNGHANYIKDTYDDASWLEYVETISAHAAKIVISYQFFPTFILFGYVTYTVSHWRQFVVYALTVQGRIHDICLETGAKVLHPEDEETRRFLYRFYRYVNTIHLLCYRDLKPLLKMMCSNVKLVDLGLLTKKELAFLEPAGGSWDMQCTLLVWAAREIELAVHKGILVYNGGPNLTHGVARLRGMMATVHGSFDYGQPNNWTANMKFVTDTNLFLIVFGLPLELWMPEQEGFFGNVPWTNIIIVFLLVMGFNSVAMNVDIATRPFDGVHDIISPDAVLSESEQAAFSMLRASFDMPLSSQTLRHVHRPASLPTKSTSSASYSKCYSLDTPTSTVFRDNNTIHEHELSFFQNNDLSCHDIDDE